MIFASRTVKSNTYDPAWRRVVCYSATTVPRNLAALSNEDAGWIHLLPRVKPGPGSEQTTLGHRGQTRWKAVHDSERSGLAEHKPGDGRSTTAAWTKVGRTDIAARGFRTTPHHRRTRVAVRLSGAALTPDPTPFCMWFVIRAAGLAQR
jgi:hypothetical protein